MNAIKSRSSLFSVAGRAISALVLFLPFSVPAQEIVDYDAASDCFVYGGGWPVDAGNASVIDVDGDGDKDLLISHFDFDDFSGQPNGMAWSRTSTVNDAPWFTNTQDIWFSAGVKPSENTFGFLTADFDNDGYLDVYCPNPYGASLYENRNGILTNVTSESAALAAYNYTMNGT